MEEEKQPNWVERRFHRENLLQTGAAELWSTIRSAIQDTCESFNKRYPQSTPVKCVPENGKRLRITRAIPANHTTTFQDETMELVVAFQVEPPVVSAIGQDGSRNLNIEVDDAGLFIRQGQSRLTPDQISEMFLAPMLFPPNKTRQSPAGPSSGGGSQSWMS